MDLPGMGRSSKPGGDYPFRLHADAVDGFLDALGLERVALVLHDWGVALGLDLLRRRPDRVRAIAFMEGHVHPIATWDEFDEGGRELFRTLRSEDEGRRLVIDQNLFIEAVLPSGMRRRLSEAEMDAYRAPFVRPADRDVIWRWVRSIPIAGEPPEMDATMRANRDALVASGIPKLLFHATPGAIIGPEAVAWFRDSLTNLTVVRLGDGLHFLPEDHGPTIGQAIADWLGTR
jgi:haloalkane dehalogenase